MAEVSMSDGEGAVWAAIATGIAALVVAVLSAALAAWTAYRGERHASNLATLQHQLQLVEAAQGETRRGITEAGLRLRERMLMTVGEVTVELEAIVRVAERAVVDGPWSPDFDEQADAIDHDDTFRELRDRLFELRARAALLPVELDPAFDDALSVLVVLVARSTAFEEVQKLQQPSRDRVAQWITAVRQWKRTVLQPT